MPEPVDSTVEEVPIPDYYLVRSDSGIHHLVDPSDEAAVDFGRRDYYATRCGRQFTAETTVTHTTDWLTPDDVIDRFTADELFDEFKPFAGQCKQCLESHQANGAEDFAILPLN